MTYYNILIGVIFTTMLIIDIKSKCYIIMMFYKLGKRTHRLITFWSENVCTAVAHNTIDTLSSEKKTTTKQFFKNYIAGDGCGKNFICH